MFCPHCAQPTRKNGKNRNGSQRFRCDACRKTFTDETTRPADRRELPAEKAILCIRMILEGSSVRSVQRLTGICRDKILALLVEAGQACERFLEQKVKGLIVDDVEADELWSFVGCKQKTCERKGYGSDRGDAWCFVAMERTSKLILAWHLDKRTPEATRAFADKLREATVGWFQLTTDGFRPYRQAIRGAFGPAVDYAQLIKVYGNPPEEGAEARYSPGEVIDTRPVIWIGQPDPSRICTSHAERQNLSMRTTLKRLARLTISHSKKWENHRAALALYFAFFNFVRVHSTLKTTPAVKAKLADRPWTVAELLQNAA